MKIVFLVSLFFWLFSAQAQLLRLDREWLNNRSFFDEDYIKKNQIAAIHIWSSDKKDDAIFQGEREFLHYVFNGDGFLEKSYKTIALKNRKDTAIYTYQYNQSNCIMRSEKQGPFHFKYFFHYKNGALFKESKYDAINGDTTYNHYYEQVYDHLKEEIKVYNEAQKPFKSITIKRDSAGNKINKRISYIRNKHFREETYQFLKGKLMEITKRQYDGKQREVITTIKYENNRLYLVTLKEETETIMKYAFTYNSAGHISAIIKRNPIEKTISIYRFEYLFHSKR